MDMVLYPGVCGFVHLAVGSWLLSKWGGCWAGLLKAIFTLAAWSRSCALMCVCVCVCGLVQLLAAGCCHQGWLSCCGGGQFVESHIDCWQSDPEVGDVG